MVKSTETHSKRYIGENSMYVDIIKKELNNLGTPAYIFDLDKLKTRVLNIKKILGSKANICYAMKANPFIIRPMDKYIDKYEVCSPGEYEICHRHNIAPEKIVVSGVNKTYESMDRILELSKGLGIFTIESEKHYEILSKLCKEKQLIINVLIRLSSGNQFGVDKENFERLANLVAEDSNLVLYGIHYYSGTQKKMKKIVKEIEMLCEYRQYLKDNYNIELHELEYGPGLIFNYFESDTGYGFEEQLTELKEVLNSACQYEEITLEMGRFIASECGSYCTSVVDIKKNEDYNYCIVDGGIHQLNYYGQTMGMKKPYMDIISDSKDLTKWNVCGSLCTVNDVILRDAMLPELTVGDILVFKNCGAYSVTEGMALFLSRELPKVMFYDKENGFRIVRRQIGTDFINEEEC